MAHDVMCFVYVGGILAFFLAATEAQIGNDPIVDTINGRLLGKRGLHNGKVYEEFLGVPFGEAPIGPLRWKKPIPAEPWEGVRNATEYSMACTHFIARFYPVIGLGGESGEDCLYLNIWVPRGVAANEGQSLPVMVWIYGGIYLLGTGEMYPGYGLALHGDVIVVNFNYRLSALGWLSTGDAESPGNYGLWDVQAALQWVQDNIAAFNGDPSRVTLFGQSAGAASVSHAIISPHTNTLFHNAIAISGSSTAMFAVTEQALGSAMLLGDMMDCGATNSQQLVECLRKIDPHVLDIWAIVATIIETGKFPNYFPVVDGDFVPIHPTEAYKSGAGKHINFITGNTNQDAAGFIIKNPLATPALGEGNSITNTNETIWIGVRKILDYLENGDDVFNKIIWMYPDIESPDYMTRTLELTQAFTDWWFRVQSNWEAQEHASAANGLAKTYQYQFSHRQSFLVGYPDWVTASHIDDVYSVLGEPFMEFYRRLYLRENYDEPDKIVSSTIMDYYSNFAHTGDPNVGPFEPEVKWEEFDPDKQNFMLQSDKFEMQSFYDDNAVDRFRFWTEDFQDMLIRPPQPTFPPSTSANEGATHRKKYTEEDVRKAVASMKSILRQNLPDPTAWHLMEQTVDEFVANRHSTL